MGFCGKIRLGHATMTSQTCIIGIQKTTQVAGGRQIAAAVDGVG
jgi:hypothetical protein